MGYYFGSAGDVDPPAEAGSGAIATLRRMA